MAAREDPLFTGAGEDGGRVVAAVALLEPVHAGEDLLREDEGVVDKLEVAKADVASVAARALEVLPEVSKDRAMSARGAGCVGGHVAKLPYRDSLGLLGLGLLDDVLPDAV